VLALKERQSLGAPHQYNPATSLVDVPTLTALQAARALCDLVQRIPQSRALLALLCFE